MSQYVTVCHGHCSDRKPRAELTAWQENRDYSQNGTKLCNTCISLALVFQIARRSNQRLTPLRRRKKSRMQQAIIDEVRQEILERTRQKTTIALTQEIQSCKEQLPDCATGCVSFGAATRRRQPGKTVPARARCKNQERQTRAPVQCPFCQQHVNSIVETGRINHVFE